MLIRISTIPEEGATIEGDEPAESLELENDRFITVLTPIRYHFSLQVASGELVVSGRLTVDLRLQCARCAEFFSTTVDDSSFLRAYELKPGVEEVDVTPDLRDGIILNIPHYPLCKPDCLGLCPRCGQNLNQKRCTCADTPVPGPWEGLNKLRL